MPDRTDPTPAATPGPWPAATEPDRVFDHGARWCANAEGHPGDHDYPDAERHIPYDECRSRAHYLDTIEDGVDVALYAARAYRFGQPRGGMTAETHIVLDTVTQRIAFTLGDALRLARFVTGLVELVDG